MVGGLGAEGERGPSKMAASTQLLSSWTLGWTTGNTWQVQKRSGADSNWVGAGGRGGTREKRCMKAGSEGLVARLAAKKGAVGAAATRRGGVGVGALRGAGSWPQP